MTELARSARDHRTAGYGGGDCHRGAVVPGPPLVLVAHGTRDEAGTALVGRLAGRVARALPGVRVRQAFVDVRPPTVADVLAEVLDDAGGPAVVVPAFLAAGYHVREDLPAQVAGAAGDRAVLTPLLGPDPSVVAAAEDRLRRAGWRPGDAVVLGAAGSRDPRARVELWAAAEALGRRLGVEVHPGYLASGEPKVAGLVARLRAPGRRVTGRRVAAASWLLAPGEFQRRLAGSGADVVADPLGVHPAVVRAVVSRYRECSAWRPAHHSTCSPTSRA